MPIRPMKARPGEWRSKKTKGRLSIQGDELGSCVGHKGNKQWVWLALDKDTKEIVGAYIGERRGEGAQGWWDSLPAVYRPCAVSYTDFWEAYAGFFQRCDIVLWLRGREKRV